MWAEEPTDDVKGVFDAAEKEFNADGSYLFVKKNPKVFINDNKNTNFTTHLSLKSIPEKCQLRKSII